MPVTTIVLEPTTRYALISNAPRTACVFTVPTSWPLTRTWAESSAATLMLAADGVADRLNVFVNV